MFSLTVETLFRLIEASSMRNRNWQIASAVAFGALCGLIPHTSLLPPLLIACAFFLPIHLPVFLASGMLVAIATVSAGFLFAPLGEWSLSQSFVLEPLSQINSIALVPWLRLNNTVVHGALLFGLFQLIPTYFAIQLGCFLFRPSRKRADPDFDIEEVPSMSFVDVPSEVFEEIEEEPDFSLDPISHELNGSSESAYYVDDPNSVTHSPIARVESFLAEVRDDNSAEPSSVAARASELASLVDDMLVAIQQEESTQPIDTPEQIVTRNDAAHSGGSPNFQQVEVNQAEEGDTSPVHQPVSQVETDDQSLRLIKPHQGHHGAPALGMATSNANTASNVSPHEEALRYLLQHLKEIKNKA